MADREVRVKLVVAGTSQFQQSMQAAAQSATNLGQASQHAQQQVAQIGSGQSGQGLSQLAAHFTGASTSATGLGQSVQGAGQQVSQFASGSAQAAGQSQSAFAGMAAGIGGVLAGIGFGAFVSDAIAAASDLNETVNKTGAIFGDSAPKIEAWADSAATSLGLSKLAALDAASGFGDMFLQLGFTGDQAVGMSTNIVQLAADLGSFNNLGTDEVLDKISGALRGEYDSLQALIPNINGARVETEALTASGKTNAAQLTAQEKATATLAIITKDTSRAQGDFAKTSDGLANSQKIAAAQFEDTKAKIGQSLLPVMQQLVKLISDVAIPVVGALGQVFTVIGPVLSGIASSVSGLVGFFTSLPGPIKAVVISLGAIAGLKMLGVFDGIRKGVAAMAAAFTGAGASGQSLGKKLLAGIGGVGGASLAAGIGAVVAVVNILGDAEKRAEQNTAAHTTSVQGLSAALKESNGALDANVRAIAASNLESAKIGNEGKSLLDIGREMGLTVTQLVDAQLGQADAVSAVYAAMVNYNKAAQASGDRDRTFGALQYSKALSQQIGLLPEATKLAQENADNAAAGAQADADAADVSRRSAEQVAESKREQAAATREAEAASRLGGEAHREEAAAARGAVVDADAYSASVAAAAAATRDGATADEYAAASKEHAAAAAEELAGRQETLNGFYQDAQAAADAAGTALSSFEQASKDSADAQSELASQAQRVSDELDRQSGRTVSLEEANSRAAATGDALADSFKRGEDGARTLTEAQINLDGTVNTSEESGRKLYQGLLDTRDAMVTQATAAYAAAGGANNVAAASAAATKAQQDTYNQFISTATAAGLSATEAENLARKYGLIPSQVTTTLTADDRATAVKNAAQAELEAFAQKQYEASISLNSSSFDATIAAANARLTALGATTTRVAGPAQARAAGGPVFGPGTATSDSIPAWLSNNEHVLTSAEVNAAGGHGAIFRLRQALLKGNAPRFAGGGPVSGSAFAGIAGRNLGDREGLVVGAFKDLADAVRDLKDAAANLAEKQQQAAKAVADATAAQRETASKGRSSVADAQGAAAEKLAAAQKKLAEAQSVGKVAAIAAAEENLAKVRTAGQAAVEKANDKAAAANRAADAKVAAATREETAATRAAKSAAERAKLAAQVQRQEAGLRSKQEALARRYDTYAQRVEATEAKLQDLRDQRQSLIDDGKSTALGIRGGILGSDNFQGKKITAKDIRAQLAGANAGASQFDSIVKKAAGLGVSGSILEQLSKDPEGRGGDVLRALAGGTKGDAAAVNSLLARLGKTGAVTGNRIASALGINSSIAATSATLQAQQAVVAISDRQLKILGDYTAAANRAAFKNQTLAVSIGDKTVREVAKLEIKAAAAAQVAKAKARGK